MITPPPPLSPHLLIPTIPFFTETNGTPSYVTSNTNAITAISVAVVGACTITLIIGATSFCIRFFTRPNPSPPPRQSTPQTSLLSSIPRNTIDETSSVPIPLMINNVHPAPSPTSSVGSASCCICMAASSNVALVPCGHLCICSNAECHRHIVGGMCPICRSKTTSLITIYKV